MKSFAAAVTIALVVILPAHLPIAAQSRSEIAYISLQRVLAEAADAKAAAKQLEETRRAKAQDVQAKQKALEATRLELANAGGLFSGRRRAELQEKEKRQAAELQQGMQQAQTDLQKLQTDLQNKLRSDMQAIVESLSKARGIRLVLNTDTAVVWASGGIDLTQEVLKSLNEKK
jgi:Skp family chaperone for outer membrane proteins